MRREATTKGRHRSPSLPLTLLFVVSSLSLLCIYILDGASAEQASTNSGAASIESESINAQPKLEDPESYSTTVPNTKVPEVQATPTPAPVEEYVRLNCYFEEDRRVVLLKKSDTYEDLIQLLERQYDAENLVVKYQDEGDLFDIKSQDNLYAALQGRKSLNLFVWSKQRKTITLNFSDNLEKTTVSVPLWVPVLASSLGFVALLLTAVLSAGPTGIEGIRRMGTAQELNHADWLHIFTTKSSKYFPILAESFTYIAFGWLTLIICDIDPSTIQWHEIGFKGGLPYIVGIVYGVVGAFAMHKLRNYGGNNTNNNNNNNNSTTTTTTTTTPPSSPQSTSEDLGDNNNKTQQSTTEDKGDTTTTDNNNNTNNNNTNNNTNTNNEKPSWKLVLCNALHEAALIFLTLGLYIPACYSLTDSILLAAISSQLMAVAAREFMEGMVTIGIGLWVYLFVSYYAYIPGILFYPSTLAWVVINILAPNKPRYDLIALMYLMESLPCAMCAAVSWVVFEVAFLNTKVRPLGM